MKLQLLLVTGAAAFLATRPAAPALRVAPRRSEEAPAEAAPEEEAAPAVEAVVEEPAAEEEAPAAAEEAAPVVAAAEEPKAEKKSKKDATPLSALEVGASYDGTVTGVAAYGCFVDIGAQSDGLVHISELSADFVSDVNSVVSEGDAVNVRVLKIDEGKKQLSLSLKPEGAGRPERKPRAAGGGKKKTSAADLQKYLKADPTEFIEGTVRTVLSWGAFVNIADGIDGLVHISRVADGRVDDLEAELSPGDKVKVRVVEVDLEKATLALAMNTYREGEAQGGGGGRAPRADRGGGADQIPDRRRDLNNAGGESAGARRARNPDAKGGQQRPKRRDPGDDLWDNTDSFDWKEVLEAQGDEDDMAAGFVVDSSGKLTLQ